MKKFLLFICLQFIISGLSAQQRTLSGKIIDSATQVAINGVTVIIQPDNRTDITDETGRFFFKKITGNTKVLTVSAVGYQKKTYQLADFKNGQTISLAQRQTQLSDVVITADNRNPYKAISETDIKLRGVSNSQEVLRIVPGLFIGQHQGGGKAEQIFLRGFDNDHGTDINMSVDGMPINMVSQAHGQSVTK
ncbi:carboxypeptidase-like regulatory domain-containing protein [Mucilaginibacter paludis]|uniref:TonB-dependent receptor plug n=1 Tax=Mucilaginibacter paludis DSM 18603 TaxID=714943 RepID=H1YHI9_9SPHI|nr:carboxypeptidase-like regulatory domain-containing protein [Mucilaginibacter paludis]EHQ26412.1 TonB-dependent receptor plug [Mucilaginibacter paludis DSM 18603]